MQDLFAGEPGESQRKTARDLVIPRRRLSLIQTHQSRGVTLGDWNLVRVCTRGTVDDCCRKPGTLTTTAKQMTFWTWVDFLNGRRNPATCTPGLRVLTHHAEYSVTKHDI